MMARSIAPTPPLTDVIRIGAFYYPVVLRPEHGAAAYEHLKRPDGTPVNFTRRYAAVQYLWRREREDMMA